MVILTEGIFRRGISAAPSLLVALLLLSLRPDPALAEIRSFDGPISASSSYVHYSEGFIVAPGSVDLSLLTFSVADDGGSGFAPAPRGRDDDEPPAEEPTETPPTDAPVQAAPAPTDAPVQAAPAPTDAPVLEPPPTDAPVKAAPPPTNSPVQAASPTEAPEQALPPTEAPVKAPPPTEAPVQAPSLTGAPMKALPPTDAPAEAAPPTDAPVQVPPPTEAPVQAPPPTDTPVEAAPPTDAPVEAAPPTDTPVEAAPPTDAPVDTAPPTDAPVQAPPPTDAPVTVPPPTESPVEAPPPTDAPVVAPKDDGGGRRRVLGEKSVVMLLDKNKSRDLDEAAVELEEEAGGDDDLPPPTGASVVDIVFFLQPPECSQSQKGCDWTDLGVGASDEDGNLRWCCTDDADQLGFCDFSRQAGRLIINKVKFAGEHRFVNIPATGGFSGHVLGGDQFKVKDVSGKYVMVIANCNDEGRDVNVSGTYSWVSKHGYLPGELFGEMYFFAAITVVYFLVFLWYGCAMQCNKESTIGIQKWILWTIFLGLLETFFNAGNYFVWNEDGVRVWFAMYTGVVLGVMKRAISRCLVVMVSLGWGVIRDSLGDQLKKIIFLGVLYVGVSAACECMKIFAVDRYHKTLSMDQEEEELFDVVTILTFVVAAIDVTFYMWILDALNGTMQYLENMSQSTKLKQYLRLRCILLLSILFAVVWAIFGIVNSYMDGGLLEEQQEWSVQAAWELNYLMVLIGVAWLWRPNKNAKEYAYVMELPSMGDDVEFETNADTITDDDGFDNDDKGGLKVDNAVDA